LRHGYFIASTGTEHGDPELRANAHRIWDSYVQSVDRDWRAFPPGRYDGASCFTGAPGIVVWRRIVEDITPPPEGEAEKVRATPYDLNAQEIEAVMRLGSMRQGQSPV
jgi:hypothetical protein